MFKRLRNNHRVLIQYPVFALVALLVSFSYDLVYIGYVNFFDIKHLATFFLSFMASFVVIIKAQSSSYIYIYSLFHLPYKRVNCDEIKSVFTWHVAKFGKGITFIELNGNMVSLSILSLSSEELVKFIEEYCNVVVKHKE